jgi:hypothetical protein
MHAPTRARARKDTPTNKCKHERVAPLLSALFVCVYEVFLYLCVRSFLLSLRVCVCVRARPLSPHVRARVTSLLCSHAHSRDLRFTLLEVFARSFAREIFSLARSRDPLVCS